MNKYKNGSYIERERERGRERERLAGQFPARERQIHKEREGGREGD
jgi:hypothetical protein